MKTILLFLGCSVFLRAQTPPKSIVYMIGDGMGLSQMSTLYYWGNTLPPNVERMPVIGLIKTASAIEEVTDSAAGATALATGQKSFNGAIAVDTLKHPIKTLFEIIGNQKSLGLVVTSSITHATPACFYAHAVSRKLEHQIAAFLPQSSIDFFAGGGIKFFDPTTTTGQALQKQFVVSNQISDLQNPMSIDQKYGFLLAENGMKSMLKGRGDYLPKATQSALDYLSQDPNGFVLVIEGSQIDWAGHKTHVKGLVEEVKDLDATLGVVLNFAEKHPDVLVVLTADHETAGFALSPKNTIFSWDYTKVKGSFNTASKWGIFAGHTATMVPLYAYGSGAQMFSGIYDNHQVFHRIINLLQP